MSLSLPPGYQIIVYSDLDGTFLDHRTYSYADSLNAFHLLTGHGIPVVFCSSKTRAEIETLLEELPIKNPFIIENGAAIYVPLDFFQFPIHQTQILDRYKIIELGIPYKKVVENFHCIQALFPQTLIGFSDMTAEEIALDAGLSVADAKRAKQREYSEVFKFIDKNPTMERRIIEKITAHDFVCAKGGRYFHMHGHHDKGLAVQMLNRLFEKKHSRIKTVAIGDSLNDLPMMAVVDQPVLVKKIDGYHDQEIRNHLPRVHQSDGIGPKGWAQTAREIASELEKT